MHPFLPKHTHGSTKSSSTSCFPTSTPQKDSPRNPKEITETWLVPTTHHNAHGITCPSNTNKGHFKLINKNTLYFKFSVLFCFS